MNRTAQELGLLRSRFANPTGLFDVDNYSTAGDMAALLCRVLERPFLRQALSTRRYTSSANDLHPAGITMRHYLDYYSELAGIDSSAIDGGKTGQLKEAGYCLASFKTIEGRTFVCCTTGADRPGDHLADHLAFYAALGDQLPQGGGQLTGVGGKPSVPIPPTAEADDPVTPPDPDPPAEPEKALSLTTAILLGLVILLALGLLFTYLFKKRIERKWL